MKNLVQVLAVAPFLVCAPTMAAIEVTSTVTNTGGNVRAQAVITNVSGVNREGTTITAVAIKEIRSAVFVIDSLVPSFNGEGGGALTVDKRQWGAQAAYGLGLPFGYTDPPTTDPTGPWFGMVWPYRDQYDYFPNSGDPLADDVGTFVNFPPNIYGFIDVDGIARGGPTDPFPAGGDPNLLLRGITGNGLSGPATYFGFDITPNFGDADRFVTIQILSTTARVVVQDQLGAFSEITVNVPAFQTMIRIPEPALGSVLAAAAMLLRRRRPRV